MDDLCRFRWFGPMPGSTVEVATMHHCKRVVDHPDEFHKCRCSATKIEDADREVHGG